MAEFLKEWLKKNKEDNSRVLKKHFSDDTDQVTSEEEAEEEVNPTASGSQSSKSDDQAVLEQNKVLNANATKPSDISFENNSLKMTVTQAPHLQEKRFRVKFSCISHTFIYLYFRLCEYL